MSSYTEGQIHPVYGPAVTITIDHPQFRYELDGREAELGIGLPQPVKGLGVIDTGAGDCCIDRRVASSMGLMNVGAVNFHGVTSFGSRSGQQGRRVHAILRIEGWSEVFSINAITVDPLDPRDTQPLPAHDVPIVLIGRDVLARCGLTYLGPECTFKIGVRA